MTPSEQARADAMAHSKPSAKALVAHLNNSFDCEAATCTLCGELAARVEMVMALPIPVPYDDIGVGERGMLEEVRRILNGE